MARPGRREGWTLVASAAFVLLLVLVEARWTPLHRLDLGVADDLNEWVAGQGGLTGTLKAVSDVGQPAVFEVVAVLAGLVLWRRGQNRTAVYVVVTVLGANLLSTLVKVAVGRTRPEVEIALVHPAGSSFPSGHAMVSFAACATAVVVVQAYRTAVATAAAVVVLAVGFSRLALGAHYLSDVVGAWLVCTVWLFLTTTYLHHRHSGRPAGSAPRT